MTTTGTSVLKLHVVCIRLSSDCLRRMLTWLILKIVKETFLSNNLKRVGCILVNVFVCCHVNDVLYDLYEDEVY